eukprot:tig00001408_g8611.t1
MQQPRSLHGSGGPAASIYGTSLPPVSASGVPRSTAGLQPQYQRAQTAPTRTWSPSSRRANVSRGSTALSGPALSDASTVSSRLVPWFVISGHLIGNELRSDRSRAEQQSTRLYNGGGDSKPSIGQLVRLRVQLRQQMRAGPSRHWSLNRCRDNLHETRRPGQPLLREWICGSAGRLSNSVELVGEISELYGKSIVAYVEPSDSSCPIDLDCAPIGAPATFGWQVELNYDPSVGNWLLATMRLVPATRPPISATGSMQIIKQLIVGGILLANDPVVYELRGAQFSATIDATGCLMSGDHYFQSPGSFCAACARYLLGRKKEALPCVDGWSEVIVARLGKSLASLAAPQLARAVRS